MQIVQEQEYPRGLLKSLHDVRFICPLCRGSLQVLIDRYNCKSCKRKYLLHDGIPDFRVFPDPYLDFHEDFERTDIVLAGLNKYDLEELLEYYWSYSDITPADLRKKFIRSVMLGEERARRTLRLFDDGTFGKKITAKNVLEIGSGTGNFLAVAGEQYEQVIGIDIAMRWLHVSRRRFMDKGLPVPPLVCCCAEYLPFADDSFDLIVAASTLEFVKDQAKVLSECSRTLRDKGALFVNSVNRFAFARDPYSYLWGVGFLPRAWQAAYVHWRRKAVYKTRTLSYREFKRMTRPKFSSSEFALPDIDPSVLHQFSPFTRFQVRVYRLCRKLPFFSALSRYIGPGWDVMLKNPTFQSKKL